MENPQKTDFTTVKIEYSLYCVSVKTVLNENLKKLKLNTPIFYLRYEMKLIAKKGSRRIGSLKISRSFISTTLKSLAKIFINFPGL